ncbi:MAG: hypothetical protein AAF108_00495 [Planctomycetota bacterium]
MSRTDDLRRGSRVTPREMTASELDVVRRLDAAGEAERQRVPVALADRVFAATADTLAPPGSIRGPWFRSVAAWGGGLAIAACAAIAGVIIFKGNPGPTSPPSIVIADGQPPAGGTPEATDAELEAKVLLVVFDVFDNSLAFGETNSELTEAFGEVEGSSWRSLDDDLLTSDDGSML